MGERSPHVVCGAMLLLLVLPIDWSYRASICSAQRPSAIHKRQLADAQAPVGSSSSKLTSPPPAPPQSQPPLHPPPSPPAPNPSPPVSEAQQKSKGEGQQLKPASADVKSSGGPVSKEKKDDKQALSKKGEGGETQKEAGPKKEGTEKKGDQPQAPSRDTEKEAALTQEPKQVKEAEKVPKKLPEVADKAALPQPSDKLEFSVKAKDIAGVKKRFPKFIFVYDLGTSHTTELLPMPLKWWNEPYDGEEFLFNLFSDHGVARTTDPTKADLFYVPMFLSRFIMLQRTNGMLTQESIRSASRMFELDIMHKVRALFPWFNKTNGLDHFTVIAADHGRCSLLPFVSNSSVYGDMFFLQYNGDLMVRSNHIDERKQMHTLAYNPSRNKAKDIPEVPCYVPQKDIVIPPFVDPALHIVAPRSTKRNYTAVVRFGKYYAREEAQAVFFNHPIRIELYNLFGSLQMSKWVFGPKPRNQTLLDYALSLFCLCPPGHSQWTSRVSLSILKGCIPVTFNREHHSPFQDSLDYSTFSVNVDPDDLPLTKRRLDRIARRETLLTEMQKSLAQIQVAFSWDPVFLNGAIARIVESLVARACSVTSNKPNSTISCLSAQPPPAKN